MNNSKHLNSKEKPYHLMTWSRKTIYSVKTLDDLLEEWFPFNAIVKKRKKDKTIEYYNVSCSFDIETTSFMNELGQKQATMYIWQMSINGGVLIGRTWAEFFEMCDRLVEKLGLSQDRVLVIYVHNLSFEFSFIKKWFTWLDVFSLDDRQPIRALSSLGIEFRCSYALSGYGLAKLGDQLLKYPIKKLEGDLDYKKLRHSKTPITDEELQYCINDVLVVTSYIQERIEGDGDISLIPLTKTGYVRRLTRKKCLEDFTYYHKLMKGMNVTPEVYLQLKRAFQGGFTHANALYVGETIENVASFDFTSSYPTCFCFKFPMTSFRLVNIGNVKDFNYYLKNYACLFDIEFKNLRPKLFQDNPLSYSKCYCENYTINNGRIVSATLLRTTITELDFDTIKTFYYFDSFKVENFRVARKQYLPKPFLEVMFSLYKKKTELKGVAGKEEEYLSSKENINAMFGMTVMDIAKALIKYNTDGTWSFEEPDLKEAINIYNNSKNRFLFYAWGIWDTAYARHNLFQGIKEFGEDYCYSDTDSIKAINYEKHLDFIEKYNKWITNQIYDCLDYHGMDRNLAHPKTIKGVLKPLGVWDFEGVYSKFKTLGAKRYMVEKDEKISFTISGLNKKVGVPYLINKAKELNCSVFNLFEENMYVPAMFTGKNTHTYIDFEQSGVMVDYLGNKNFYHELSSCHLSEADYTLSLSKDFINYLNGIKLKGV